MTATNRPKLVNTAGRTVGKEIRILTGVHAGARLALQPGLLCLGKSDKAKVRISDWDSPPLWIRVHDDGRIEREFAKDATGDSVSECVGEFEPLRFGNIVVAFGESSGLWPSDLELLETMLRPAPSPVTDVEIGASRPRGFGPKWGLVLAGAILLGVSVTSAHQIRSARTDTVTTPAEELSRLQNALGVLDQPELRIVADGGMTTVRGLVNTSADLQHVIRSLNNIAPGKIQPEITVVEDVLENIKESLHDSNLAVSYSGDGVFQVSGATPRAKQDRAILDRIHTDLGANVTRLDVSIESTDDGFPVNTDAAIQTGDVHYADTTDGIKYFVQDTDVLVSR